MHLYDTYQRNIINKGGKERDRVMVFFPMCVFFSRYFDLVVCHESCDPSLCVIFSHVRVFQYSYRGSCGTQKSFGVKKVSLFFLCVFGEI